MNRILLMAACSLVLLSSCHFFGEHVKGTGNVISQSRPVSNFDRVSVSSAIDLYVKQDSSFSARIETDDNLQKYIIVSEENGVLKIREEDNINIKATGKVKVYVSAPHFKGMEASGACNIYSENMISSNEPIDIDLSGSSEARVEVKAPKISAGLSGASSVSLKGETKEFEVDGTGSSELRCFDLLTEVTSLELSGSSDAEVSASVKLDVRASGSSDVRYKGNATVSQDISGAGSVKKVQ